MRETLEKEMATHSSVLAWRIPGMGEPGGLRCARPSGVPRGPATSTGSLVEEKGTTEDEMAGWHCRLDGHESE